MGRNQGISSKNVVSKPVRYGQGALKADLRGVSQIGQGIGNKVTEKTGTLPNTIKPLREGPMGGMGAIKLGNQVAAETVCGVGGSRTIMRSGQQGQHGAVAGSRRPQARGILNNE